MTDETEIKTQDLLFYPSAQLNQNDDGGGQLVKTPLTDATSEVFDPTSSVQKVNGGFTARLVYPAVLTEGREKLLGSFCAVSRIPDQENEDVLLFAGDYYGEEWKNAKNRIEAFSVPTIFSKMTLLGFANKGTKQIQFYQRADEADPLVGECYCLRLRLQKEILEYFRIEAVSSEIRTFEDASGSFQKKVINITTTDTLSADWEGLDYPVRGKAEPITMTWETHISDAAHYYGAAKITKDINKNDKEIRVNRIYGQVVPCTTTNKAHGDQYPAANNFYLPLGRSISRVRNKGDLYAPHGILPNTYLQQGIYDNGAGQWLRDNSILDINYAEGIIYNANNYDVSFQEAVLASNAAYSSFINIDQTNQQSEWAIFLDPYPARGSVHISWLSGGMWFDLTEGGDRVLRDNFGSDRGRVSRDGSVIFSLPDLPDAYSQIVILWSPEEFFRNFADGDLEAVVSAKNINSSSYGIFKMGDERPIVPNSLTVIAGGSQATDNGNGHLVGALGGVVEYAIGYISATGIKNGQVRVKCKRYTGASKTKKITPEFIGSNYVFNVDANIARGSFRAVLVVRGIKYATQKAESIQMPTGGFFINTGIKSNTSSRPRWVKRGAGYVLDLRTNQGSSNNSFSSIPSSPTPSSSEPQSYSEEAAQYMELTDNGEGGLFLNGEPISGTIDYQLGVISSDLVVSGLVNQLDKVLNTSGEKIVSGQGWKVKQYFETDYSFDVVLGICSYVVGNASEDDDFTVSTGLNTFDLLGDKPKPYAPVYNSWTFEINGKIYYENRGIVYSTYNVANGLSGQIGELDDSGVLTLEMDSPINSIKILSGIYVLGGAGSNLVCGRTPAAPVVPQSFNCRVYSSAGLRTATANAEGVIEGEGLTGTIDYRTGFFMVMSSDEEMLRPETLKFNCTSLNYIPVNRSIIGVDTVRFRNDGKTPILRAGDTVLIYDRKTQDLGSAFTVGTVCDLGRTGLDRVAVRDAKGMRVPADYYDEDLNAGKITFNSSLNLTGFVMPLHAITSKEELNRIVKADYSGAIELQNPISRDFPADGDLFISSCLVQGDLESQFTTPFSQVSWTNVWQDTRIGNELLAKLNVVDYPMEITNEGAITQRWLIQFTSKTQFNIIGENIGLAGQSDTLQDCEPINPATQKPYFKIKKEAFTAANGSSLWASGNCIRFNTTATNFPMWIIKTVQPVEHDQSNNLERTQFEVLFAGDSIIPE